MTGSGVSPGGSGYICCIGRSGPQPSKRPRDDGPDDRAKPDKRKERKRPSHQRYEATGERIPGQPRAYTGASGRKRSVVPGYDSERDVTRTSRASENFIGAVGLCAAIGAAIGGTQGAGDAAGLGALLGGVVGILFYLLLTWLLKGGPMGS